MSVVCSTGKVGYRSRRLAKLARRRATHLRSGSSKYGSVRPYRCPECDLWHLGHVPTSAIRKSRSEVFEGIKPVEQPRPKLAAAKPAELVARGPLIVSAHVWFAMRLCEEPRCGHEEPCPEHQSERRAA
jgi:hypothetical protein